MLTHRFYRNVSAVCLVVAGVAIGLGAAGPDTRLADAAKQGDLKAVETLLSQKADVNATAADGTVVAAALAALPAEGIAIFRMPSLSFDDS